MTAAYRSQKHTDLLHGAPCFFRFPHAHNGPSVPCHCNSSVFGRGKDFKTPDWAVAAGCPAAHYEIDHGKTMDRETKFYEWLRAFVATSNWLYEQELLIVNPRK